MVTVLDDNSPSTQRSAALSKLLGGIGNAGASFGGAFRNRKERASLAERFQDEAFKNVRNPDLQQLMLKSAMDKESKSAETQQKLQALQKFKQSPEYEKLSDMKKFALEQEILGLISGGTSKSLINADRESSGREFIEQFLSSSNRGSSSDLMGGTPSMNGSGSPSPEENKPSSILDIPEAALQAMLTNKETAPFAESMLARQKEERDRNFLPQAEYIKHAAKENSDYIDTIGQMEKDLPTTEFALAGIEDALGNAGKWSAFQDTIAERTGYEGARSTAGAELDSFIKTYFLGDLTSIKGGRANVFLEKQIRDAYPKAGRDPISNQKVAVGMRMKEAINKLEVEHARSLEKEEIKKYGYPKPGFKSRVRESMRKEVEMLEKKAIDTLHHLSKIEESRDKIFRKQLQPGEVLMMDQEGNPFAVPKKEATQYKEQGYLLLGEK